MKEIKCKVGNTVQIKLFGKRTCGIVLSVDPDEVFPYLVEYVCSERIRVDNNEIEVMHDNCTEVSTMSGMREVDKAQVEDEDNGHVRALLQEGEQHGEMERTCDCSGGSQCDW